MLMPKKVKYRKQQRGRMCGKAWRGSDISFGEFGLKALSCGWITDRQIEAARIAMTRSIKRGAQSVLRLSRRLRGRACRRALSARGAMRHRHPGRCLPR